MKNNIPSFATRSTRLAFAITTALASVAQAQTSSTPQQERVEPITISGENYRADLAPYNARNAMRTPESARNNTQTITRDEIELMRPRDVFELVNSATGVIATQGSRKGFSGLTIRGDSNFRWIIDGTYLQPTMASRALRSLPVSAIEEVKIVRGGSALTLGPMSGSASPGGAPVDGFIVVRTRKPERSEVQLRLAGESNDTVQGSVWAGKAFADRDLRAYVAGVVAYADTNGPSDKLDNGATYNAGSQSLGGLAKAGIAYAGWIVDFMLFKDDGTFQIPNANSHGTGQGSWYMDPSRTDVYSLSGSKAWDGTHTTVFGASHSVSDQTFWTANTSAGPYSSVWNRNVLTHANVRHNMDFASKTRVVIGGDYAHWDAPNGQQYYEGIQREERTSAWFGQIEQKLLNDQLSLDASYRREKVLVLHGLDYYTGGQQPFGGTSSPLRTTDKSLPASQFASVGARFEIHPQWAVTARAGTAKTASTGLNPAPGVVLADDEQQKWELGVDGKVDTWMVPSLNFFSREVKNEKSLAGYTYVATNGTTQTCRTAAIPSTGALSPKAPATLTPCYAQGDTKRAGIELAASGSIAPRTTYRASYTHFTTRNNAAAWNTPANIAEATLAHGIGNFTVNATVKHVSAYRGSSTDASPFLGGYTRYDLGVGYDFRIGAAKARASAYGRNLSDRRYETSNGVQDIGRTVGLELLVNF